MTGNDCSQVILDIPKYTRVYSSWNKDLYTLLTLWGFYFTRCMWVLWSTMIADDDYEDSMKLYEECVERWAVLLIDINLDLYGNHIYPEILRYVVPMSLHRLWDEHHAKFGK